MEQCLLLIACLIAGYLCGCYGRFPCDGVLVVHEGDSPELRLPLSEEAYQQRKYIMLKVVRKKGENR